MYLLILEDNTLYCQIQLTDGDIQNNIDGIMDIIKFMDGKFYKLKSEEAIDCQNQDSWIEIPFNPIEED